MVVPTTRDQGCVTDGAPEMGGPPAQFSRCGFAFTPACGSAEASATRAFLAQLKLGSSGLWWGWGVGSVRASCGPTRDQVRVTDGAPKMDGPPARSGYCWWVGHPPVNGIPGMSGPLALLAPTVEPPVFYNFCRNSTKRFACAEPDATLLGSRDAKISKPCCVLWYLRSTSAVI